MADDEGTTAEDGGSASSVAKASGDARDGLRDTDASVADGRPPSPRPTTSPATGRRLEARLAEALLARHPGRAAIALEQLGLAPALDFLSRVSPEHLARVAPQLSPQFGGEVLRALPLEQVASTLAHLSHDVAARLARRLGERTEEVLGRLPEETRESLAALLRFDPDSAGGLMDPRVLALPGDLTAAQALERVRELSEHARYNVYVVDRQQVLIGVLNLRELLLARPSARLAELMVQDPHSISASAGRASIVAHPGWQEAHSLPVVDAQRRYLGAIRYRTLRALEESMRVRAPEAETSQALGELLAVGAGGFVRALSASGGQEEG